ncbi:polysaccharide deacetylase family protein [Maribacter halichondriae]|uniref:polysaccharide deacetylase family protein n=1 Tax=Maribacter halichondriae TaxID=2980554 RepID=UPI002359DFC1|nr:polysaccharide deacetylase family protein [Maribacter sp. Hal144]
MLTRRVINPVAILIFLGLIALDFFVAIPIWGYSIVVLLWFLTTLFGSFFIRWNYHLTSLHSNKKISENWVAITFDDGPNHAFTPKVLDLLKHFEAQATFFCIGENIVKNPNILKEIIANGHSIGNHTYSHSKTFGFFGLEKVKAELLKTKSVAKDLTGREMNLFRPAFGVTNPMVEKAVKQLRLTSVGWNIRSLDTTPRSKEMVFKRITSKLSKGDIILLHDTSEKTVAVLERLLVFLKEKNLESVTVERLLEIEAYG